MPFSHKRPVSHVIHTPSEHSDSAVSREASIQFQEFQQVSNHNNSQTGFPTEYRCLPNNMPLPDQSPDDMQDFPMIFRHPSELSRSSKSSSCRTTTETTIFRSHSPSRDSGLSDHQQRQATPPVEKFYLDKQCAILIKELKTVAQLTEDFQRDVALERETCRDLLSELERKIKPFLINLDEQIVAQEVIIKRNVDRCLVTDCRLNWLLRYNSFMLELRKIIELLTSKVYDELEQILRLKTRGCFGLGLNKEALGEQMVVISDRLDKLETAVRAEMAKSEASYEQNLV